MNDEVYAAQLERLHRLAHAIDPQLTRTFSKVKTSTLLEAATDKLTALNAEVAILRDAIRRESVASLLALVEELEPGGFPEGHWPHAAVAKARFALEAGADADEPEATRFTATLRAENETLRAAVLGIAKTLRDTDGD